MLIFPITIDLKVHGTTEQVDAVFLIAQADFNHTDIILLFDDEVQRLISAALDVNVLPEWLTLINVDEYYET